MNVPQEFQGSKALEFIQSRGWNWKPATLPNIELEVCAYCSKGGYGHLYMEIHGNQSDQMSRDGLHQCHRCGKGGSLYSLKQHLGVATGTGYVSNTTAAGHQMQSVQKDKEVLPDIEVCHQSLLADEEAMDYLENGRGFSRAVIQRMKIGLVNKRYFRECGEVRALVYPYLVNGQCVFVHYRTLPRMPLATNKVPKAFSSPTGWDATLYNLESLYRPGLKDITFVEGEPNTIAAIDHGYENICGVPGANFKRADWIQTLDQLELDKIYICYDRDKVGQKAAQELAARIGVERCWKIDLPDFAFDDPETGETKQGKDLNEWYVYGGGTAEEFEKLKQAAHRFDVDGVAASTDALTEFEDEVLNKGVEPKYRPKWPSLAKHVGFDVGDVIDIIAPEKIGKTTFGLNLMEDMVDRYGEDGVIICLEMTRSKIARKWTCHVAGIADNIPNTPEEATALKELFVGAFPYVRAKAQARPGMLYFCYPKYKTVDDIYKLMIDCIRRYGVKWVMLDNLQRLADTTPAASRNRTIHLSEISKKITQIGKDYGVQMVRIVQPHRVMTGKIVSTDNVDGASQIEKDCDCAMTLHRNRVGEISANDFESLPFYQQDMTFDEKMLCTVGLTRYSAGGSTTLFYDGARSTVSEYNVAQIASIKANANKNVGYKGQWAALQAAAPQVKFDETEVKVDPASEAGAITL